MAESEKAEKRVLIIQGQMKQYRVPFFDQLCRALKRHRIELRVAYSAPNDAEASKGDNADVSPEYGVKVRGFWLFRNRLLYQPLLGEIGDADLVIVEYANKHLLNHLLLGLSLLKIKKLAFWGLGENRQEDRSAFSEFYKRLVTKRVDWWFAYTSGAASYVAAQGMSSGRITSVQNAVDTSELQRQLSGLADADITSARKKLGIAETDPTGIFCGSLDRVKGIPFLIAAAKRIRDELPNFHLIIVGAGPDCHLVEREARSQDWIHYTGPAFGAQKALFMRLAHVMLHPGRIGLVVLDAFTAGLPLVTIKIPIHGPEAEYLENDVNGLLIENDAESYAKAVVHLLKNPAQMQKLKSGALHSHKQYNVEKMTEAFQSGIIQCLASISPLETQPSVRGREESRSCRQA